MFLFRPKTSLLNAALLNGATDCHSHILWGVDDGIRSREDSLTVLAFYRKAGLKNLWCTPHVMEDVPNTTAALTERFEELCAAAQRVYLEEDAAARGEAVSLHLGAEYMMDNLFLSRLRKRDLLTTYEPDTVLVETSTVFPPVDLEDILSEMMGAAYRPLLAHPERYIYMERKDYRRLVARGVRLQLNLPSLAGFYGPLEKKKAQWLLEEGLYYCAGSDTHRPRQLQRMAEEKCLPKKHLPLLKQILIR